MWTHKMQNKAFTNMVKGARNMFRSWKRGVKCPKTHETRVYNGSRHMMQRGVWSGCTGSSGLGSGKV